MATRIRSFSNQFSTTPELMNRPPTAPTVRETTVIQRGQEAGYWPVIPNLINAARSLFSIIVVALFVITFIAQPFRIPSGSMERTLLVGDFLLVNKSIFAPPGEWGWLLPYRKIARNDIVVFHFPINPSEDLVKRVVAVPGDRIRIDGRQVYLNGVKQKEAYAYFEKTYENSYSDQFPSLIYTDPGVNMRWWKQMREDQQDGQLLTPKGSYFVLGDNRNDSRDSRYWGFVPCRNIVGMPFLIYFSLSEPEAGNGAISPNDRLGHEKDMMERVLLFARWNRVLKVVY